MQSPEQREDGKLRNHSFLPHYTRAHAVGLTRTQVLEMDLDTLRKAAEQWADCRGALADAVRAHPVSAAVKDGVGPIAQELGPRFNHRIGAGAGILYAAEMYQQRLQQLIESLTTIVDNMTQTEDNVRAMMQDPAS